MTSALKNVIVAGATGNLGPAIINALHRAKFNVAVLARSGSDLSLPDYVIKRTTDYTLTSLVAALKDQDVVVSLLPVTATGAQLTLIEAAVRARIQRFVPSEFGWDPSKQILAPIKDRLAGKAQAIDKLKEVCTDENGMTWTAVITGVFLDWSLKKVPSLGFKVSNKQGRIVDSGREMATGSTANDMGTAVANLLSHPAETANRWVRMRSVQFNQNQLLDALKTATDPQWTIEQVKTEDIEESRKRNIAGSRFQEAFLDTLAIQLFEDGAGRGMVVNREEADNNLLGIDERDILAVVKELI